jgi:hypothetical protein
VLEREGVVGLGARVGHDPPKSRCSLRSTCAAEKPRCEHKRNETKRFRHHRDAKIEWSVASKRNKTQKTQAVSGVVSRRKPKHFLEARQGSRQGRVAKTGQLTTLNAHLPTNPSKHARKPKRRERENP